ncbi:TPA: hypothetical protein ACMEVT_004943 [Klebsiella pneumoniae]
MSELSYLEKLLDGAEVEWLTAAEIFNIKNGYTPSKAKKEFWEDGISLGLGLRIYELMAESLMILLCM